MQGTRVRSLVKELGSCMLPGAAQKKTTTKKITIMLTPGFYRRGNQDAERGKWWTQGHHTSWWLENPESDLSIRLGFISVATRARHGFLPWHCQGLTVILAKSLNMQLAHHHYPWHHPLLHNWGFTFQPKKTNLFMISTPSQLWTVLASRETEELSFTHH